MEIETNREGCGAVLVLEGPLSVLTGGAMMKRVWTAQRLNVLGVIVFWRLLVRERL